MLTDSDILAFRKNTAGCRENYIHLNAAGAALQDQSVLEAVTGHLLLEGQVGGYEAARQVEDQLEAFYVSAAKLLHCSPDEVAFMENATRAWQAAFLAFDFKPGDRILTSEIEYASNFIAYLRYAQHKGVSIDVAPMLENGDLDLAGLEALITEKTRLISLSHVPTSSGTVLPAAAVGAIARGRGIPFLLDACQSLGQMPIDVQAIGCDMLSGTGRKYLRGPRATGLLYVSKQMQDRLNPVVFDLHSATWTDKEKFTVREDARRFENWEQNLAGKLGLARAIENAATIGLEPIAQRVQYLASMLREMLRTEIPKARIHDIGSTQCGIVSFSLPGWDGEALRTALFSENIAVSVVPGWNTFLDAQRRQIDEFVRASVHYYTTEDELSHFVSVLKDI